MKLFVSWPLHHWGVSRNVYQLLTNIQQLNARARFVAESFLTPVSPVATRSNRAFLRIWPCLTCYPSSIERLLFYQHWPRGIYLLINTPSSFDPPRLALFWRGGCQQKKAHGSRCDLNPSHGAPYFRGQGLCGSALLTILSSPRYPPINLKIYFVKNEMLTNRYSYSLWLSYLDLLLYVVIVLPKIRMHQAASTISKIRTSLLSLIKLCRERYSASLHGAGEKAHQRAKNVNIQIYRD